MVARYTADGIPGLPRFGEKTASTLLGEYEHIERIPPSARDWRVRVRGADTLAATLRERREDALLYRLLATLVTDVPLQESLSDLEWHFQFIADYCRRIHGAGTQSHEHDAKQIADW